jgi:hypothetical protein
MPAVQSRPCQAPGAPARRTAMTFILSHQVLDEVLQKHRIKSNDLAGIDKLFGGADGYYWYHTMRHMCPKQEVMVWASQEDMRAALQNHENATAAEDEVKPQELKDAHVAAIASLLGVRV